MKHGSFSCVFTSIVMQIPLCDCLSFNSWNKWQDDSDFYCLYQFPRLGLCPSRFSLPVTISSGVLWKKGFANFVLFVIFRLQVNFTPNFFFLVEFTPNTCRLLSFQWVNLVFSPFFHPPFLTRVNLHPAEIANSFVVSLRMIWALDRKVTELQVEESNHYMFNEIGAEGDL